ncbi:MAG: LPXTG cell wall anchor domain-containing protein [Clostridia bacterium]|nr:LPXTG cell wall anchor domain-containing protein [Clostridia bacterium]
MLDPIFVSPNTGDGFNPILVGAVGIACLVAIIFLVFSGRGRK